MLTRALAVLGMCAVVFLAPPATSACISIGPKFDEVIAKASVIVDGHLLEAQRTGASYRDPDRFTIAVDRVLRGEAGETLVVDQPSTLCLDRIGLNVSVGERLIVALDVEHFDKVLAPYWDIDDRGRLGGTAQVPAGAQSLDDIAARIARMPNTSAEAPAEPALPPWAPFVVGGLALAVFLARPISRRRRLP